MQCTERLPIFFLFKKHYIQLNWITHKKKTITVQIIILNIRDKILHPTRLRTIWGLDLAKQPNRCGRFGKHWYRVSHKRFQGGIKKIKNQLNNFNT